MTRWMKTGAMCSLGTVCRLGAVCTLTIMLTLLLGSAGAQAQEASKPNFAKAKKHFKSGQAFMQMERWGAAVEEFTQAYEITKDGLVMGQVALAYEKGGDYEAAKQAMVRYRDALPEGERASAEAMIKKYDKLIAEGKSKHLILPAEAAAKAEQEAAAKAKAEQEAASATAEEEAPAEGGSRKRLYTWIAAGAAGALALSGLVVGLNAQSKYDQLSDECKPICSDSEVDSVKTRALVTDILLGAAAAAAITATVLYFVEGRSSSGERSLDEPVEGEEEDSLVQRIRVTPVMGRGSYGLGAGLSF